MISFSFVDGFRLRLTLVAAVLSAATALGAGACSSEGGDGGDEDGSSSGTSGGTCETGYLYGEVCEEKCASDECLKDPMGAFANTCVDNVCALVCDSHTDCFNLFGF